VHTSRGKLRLFLRSTRSSREFAQSSNHAHESRALSSSPDAVEGFSPVLVFPYHVVRKDSNSPRILLIPSGGDIRWMTFLAIFQPSLARRAKLFLRYRRSDTYRRYGKQIATRRSNRNKLCTVSFVCYFASPAGSIRLRQDLRSAFSRRAAKFSRSPSLPPALNPDLPASPSPPPPGIVRSLNRCFAISPDTGAHNCESGRTFIARAGDTKIARRAMKMDIAVRRCI